MKMTDTIQMLDELLQAHEQLLTKLERRLTKLPAGNLYIKRQNGKEYYLRRIAYNGKRLQIPIPPQTKSGGKLIEELYEKRAVYHGLPILRKNTATLKAALKALSVYDPESYVRVGNYNPLDMQDAFSAEDNRPGSQHLILPDHVFLPGQLNAGRWIADTKARRYQTNPYRPENRKHPTKQGYKVRSKSEASWDNELFEAGLIFRYESAFVLENGKVIYPDFTVLLPGERRLVIIEHFGRMDDPFYAMKNLQRLQEYAESGYRLGEDLFFTMETREQPLTRPQIRAVMRQIGL